MKCSHLIREKFARARFVSCVDDDAIYDDFLHQAISRVSHNQGDPFDTETTVGAQASNDQLEKILSYIDIGKKEGAKVLAGTITGRGGYYIKPTIFEGHNKMRMLPGRNLWACRVGDEIQG